VIRTRAAVNEAKIWSDADKKRLTQFWSDGMFLSEIARRFHCSRVAVQREVRRLGLPLRPSPIRPPAEDHPPRPLARGASTLPPLPSSTRGDP
jgi:hypothetical protein